MIIEDSRGRLIKPDSQLLSSAVFNKHYDIIMLCGSNWHVTGGGQRPVGLALAWAKMGKRVLYVECWERVDEVAIPVPPNITVVNKCRDVILPYTLSCDLLYVSFPEPFYIDFIRQCRASAVHYDCYDGWTAMMREHHISWFDPSWEDEVVSLSHTISAVSQTLVDDLTSRYGRKVVLCPNAADEERFRPLRSMAKRKKIVYVGTLGKQWEWISHEAIVELARAYRKWELMVVGGTLKCPAPKNVILPGQVPHDQLTTYMRGGRIGIVPFKKCGSSYFCDPIKAWEYLASGMVVAATNVPALDEMPNTVSVHCEDPVRGLLDAVGMAMEMTYKELGDEFWRENTWESRARQILEIAEGR